MPETQHGTTTGYGGGCRCEDCREAARAYDRERRRRDRAEDSWALDLRYEAEVHDVRTLPKRRRLAMMLRRTAERVRYANGNVVSSSALVSLLYLAADELDAMKAG